MLWLMTFNFNLVCQQKLIGGGRDVERGGGVGRKGKRDGKDGGEGK